ncbi:MAG: hypothetical protein KAI73_04160 [Rhodospirillaceae bacterium]|nr:hypothetical protein [Rhodospirillaceae bacterium]
MANRQTETVTYPSAGVNQTIDLEDPTTNLGLLPDRRKATALAAGNSLPTPGDVTLVVTNASAVAAYLALDADLPDPGGAPGNDESEPTTNIIFFPATTGVVAGPYSWPGLPKLRMLANCTVRVTAVYNVKGA